MSTFKSFLFLCSALCTLQLSQAYHPIDFDSRLEVIAFGSCNRDTMEQPLWPIISGNQPDLWIWGGDNVYADWPKRSEKNPPYDAYKEWIQERYSSQFEKPAYVEFREQTAIIGTWDDHDYGRNNAVADFPLKAVAKQSAVDFFELPADDPRRAREGIYGAYDFGPEGERVKVILLDNRYFATSEDAEAPDLLGDTQRSWLSAELEASTAQIHLIVSGSQVLSKEHRWDKWSNYPEDYKWLLDTIKTLAVPGVVLLSGDRHIHEISVLEELDLGYPLVDITSSGLTHYYSSFTGEPNSRRSGDVHVGLGFGLIQIDWDSSPIQITAEIRDLDNAVQCQAMIKLP